MLKCIGLLTCAVLVCFSCKNPEPEKAGPPQKVLTYVQHRAEVGEFGHLSSCSGMLLVKDHLFFSEGEDNRVMDLDLGLNPIRQIGRAGSGPGEFAFPGLLSYDQNRLFVYNSGPKRVAVFDLKGGYLSETPLPGIVIMSRFAPFDDFFFFSSPELEKPISAVSSDGQILYQMGKSEFNEDFLEKRARNRKHLFVVEMAGQPFLFAMGETEPTLELFQVTGEPVFTQSFNAHPDLAPRIQEAETERQKNPKYKGDSFLLFVDAEVVGQDVLAMVYSHKAPHKFLRFRIEANGVTYKETYVIQHDLFAMNFTWDGKETLYLYEIHSRQILKFKLTEQQ